MNTFMSNLKTVRNVNESTWAEIKAIAARHRVSIGALLDRMTKDYEKNSNETWSKILNPEKILSDKEANDINNAAVKLRKEYGYRK